VGDVGAWYYGRLQAVREGRAVLPVALGMLLELRAIDKIHVREFVLCKALCSVDDLERCPWFHIHFFPHTPGKPGLILRWNQMACDENAY